VPLHPLLKVTDRLPTGLCIWLMARSKFEHLTNALHYPLRFAVKCRIITIEAYRIKHLSAHKPLPSMNPVRVCAAECRRRPRLTNLLLSARCQSRFLFSLSLLLPNSMFLSRIICWSSTALVAAAAATQGSVEGFKPRSYTKQKAECPAIHRHGGNGAAETATSITMSALHS
jgi:hypothetical protein